MLFCVDPEDEDILEVNITIDDVVATRKFRRHLNLSAQGAGGRRHSIC